ncbi:hypothetical protein K2P56_01960 [Patescibacteria group bacterium]|nr:hypothetical protein [Patescibacteria group bacterium]
MRRDSSLESAVPSDSLRGRFVTELSVAMKGRVERDNYMIDRLFGQSWNLGGLSPAELNYLANYFYPIKGEQPPVDSHERIKALYEEIVSLNPELSGFPISDIGVQIDVIRGVASGLHVNDIRYFAKDLRGSGTNMSAYDRALCDKAQSLYYGQFGDREQVKLTDGVTTFILSNETARRIIENRPYEKTIKKAP